MNMVKKKKPGFHETPIGWIPVQWALGTVSDYISSLQAGVSVNSTGTENDCIGSQVGILKTSAVSGGRFYAAQHKTVVPDEVGRVTTPVVKDRIIISRMNTPALVGESGYVSDNYPNLFLPDRLWQTIPSDEPHSQRWLSYWLQLPTIKRLICSSATGTSDTMKNISKDVLLSLPIPRTPLSEQKKIAVVLTAVDDKLDVITRQIAATQTIKQGMMQILFSRGAGTQGADGRWVPHAIFKDSALGEIPATWNARPLVNLAQESRKRNSGSLDDNLLCGVLKSQGLVPMRERVKGVSTERCRIVEPDAFAYNPMRINIGSIARNLSQRAVMVSPDYVVFASIPSLLSADFLDHFRNSHGWTRFVEQSGDGGVRIRIYFEHLSHVLIPTPPMPEQKRIAEILNNIDAKVKALSDKQTYYQTLKRGLMQKLLTGEWRVRLDDVALTD